MDNKIEELIKLSGNQNRYQYFTLLITFLFWLNICSLSVAIPFLEKTPDVTYENDKGEQVTVPITYAICESNISYTVIPSPESSWVNDFEIYCDRTKVGLIGSFANTGFTTGALLFPVVTKFLTHKPIILISTSIYIVFVLLSTIFKTNYWVNVSLLIGVTLFSNISSYSLLVVVEEIVSTEKRVLFGNIVTMGFSFSGIIYVLVFYAFNNWLYVFYCAIGTNFIIGIIYFFFIYDSPRGYIAKKNIDKTLDILRRIAKFNKKLDDFESKINTNEYQETLQAIMDQDKTNSKNQTEKITTFSLIKYASIRKKFLALCILFFLTYGVYNGIVIGAKTIPGNLYLNFVLLYVMEGSSYFITGFLTNIPCLGRKKTLFTMYMIATICMLVLFFFNIPDNLQLIPFLIARFCVSGVVTTYYTFSLENYPTPVRTLGFGINATFGNFGGIISPMLIEFIHEKYMQLIYAIILVLNGLILMLFLKETVGLPMQETIEEIPDTRVVEGKLLTNNE